ncbi:MAG: winged helix-turn-helix transcriptional regulator [Ruminiclostridium sp.]|nr:winged helix-turn-helix transcriptional regulator [Ruminiclostridium sp.]
MAIKNCNKKLDIGFLLWYHVDMIKHIKTSEQLNNKYLLEECNECLELFHALSDKTRQEIVKIFADIKEVCVTDIAKKFTLSRPTISHHLNLMKRSKLLNSRKEGKEIYYSLNKDYIIKLFSSILDSIKRSE